LWVHVFVCIVLEFRIFVEATIFHFLLNKMLSAQQGELKPPMTNLQRELLRVFALELPEEDLAKVRTFIAKLLLERAHEAADRTWQEQGFSEATVEQILHGHERTPYRALESLQSASQQE
jgi:hypothetical protein